MEDTTQQLHTDTTTEVEKSKDIKELVAEAANTSLSSKAKKQKNIKNRIAKGVICVKATYNNTLISITDSAGNVLAWGSAGKTGFKGAKKSTPYAGGKTMEDALSRVKNRGLAEVDIQIKGIGPGREQAVRAIFSSGLTVLGIRDITPTAHGGVRPPKPRRV